MTICGVPGAGMPRSAKQAEKPHLDEWAARVGYSPFAPWENDCLIEAYRSSESSRYITSSSEDLFSAFQEALDTKKVTVTCLPSKDEIQLLIELMSRREAAKKDIVDQVQYLGLRNPLIELVLVARPLETSLSSLVDKTLQEADRPIFFAKARYNRVRAYQLLPELAPEFLPAGFFPMHPSFPSGHSTQAHLVVNVLAAVFKEDKVDAARDLAWQIGKNREIAGLHYSSDTTAGYHLAGVLIEDAQKSPAFRADCEKARADYGL